MDYPENLEIWYVSVAKNMNQSSLNIQIYKNNLFSYAQGCKYCSWLN